MKTVELVDKEKSQPELRRSSSAPPGFPDFKLLCPDRGPC